jgi:hypothetical protein
MKIEVTKNVRSHHTNPDYPTLRIVWGPDDSNFHVNGDRADWCPKDKEVLDIVFELSLLSDSFFQELVRFVKAMDQVRGKG